MTILVTGGMGYVGSHTILELLTQGYEVVAIDNCSNSKPAVLDRVKKLSGKDISFYKTDLRDKKGLDEVFRTHKIDCVMHFAALKAVGESVEKPLFYYEHNLNSTLALCNAMEKYGVTKFIFSSSASVYRSDNLMPLTEESVAGDCINPYAWTKFMCEQILKDAAAVNSDWSVAVLRYFNVIGAHESGDIGEDPQGVPNNLMPYIAQVAVGRREYLSVYGDDYDTPDGTCIRDYIHVSDVAAGHVAAIDYLAKNKGVNMFNLGTGKGTSVLEFVEAFEKASGITINKKIAPRRPGDLPIGYASVDKAKRELNWTAVKTVEDAAADTWHWQSKNPQGYEA
ncbi:MAG: UDP-glucose 4-epimerase GalE [Defluviitaleaceae bacterium]|nr:UDP-glucose 4-epimerase GalE [Defluviitaleaceae bacterium]